MKLFSKENIHSFYQLSKYGFRVIFWHMVYAFSREVYSRYPRLLLNRKIIYHAEFTITQGCSLKCKYCASLMQYFKNPTTFSVETICADIDKFFVVVKFAIMLRFLGGEPFLHKGLDKILIHMAKYKKQYGLIGITTNATVVPDDATCVAMKKSKVVVRCSDYGDKSRKLSELTEKLRRFKIPYEIENHSWSNYREPSPRNVEKAASKWTNCYRYGPCRTVKNGKLFFCTFLSNGEDLGIFPYSDETGVSLDANPDKIWAYLKKTTHFVGCEYCGGDERIIEAAVEQCDAPLEYTMMR